LPIVEPRKILKLGQQEIHAARVAWNRASGSTARSQQHPDHIITERAIVGRENAHFIEFSPCNQLEFPVPTVMNNAFLIKLDAIADLGATRSDVGRNLGTG
jgi:hypothetical protein